MFQACLNCSTKVSCNTIHMIQTVQRKKWYVLYFLYTNVTEKWSYIEEGEQRTDSNIQSEIPTHCIVFCICTSVFMPPFPTAAPCQRATKSWEHYSWKEKMNNLPMCKKKYFLLTYKTVWILAMEHRISKMNPMCFFLTVWRNPSSLR